ncbi:MAG: hypothetical protein ACXW2C_09230 [Acidimicrobiia bacterium]
MPPLRAALTSGPVVARDGDYYGPVVHVASRLAGLAPPGTLVGSRALVDRISPDGLVASLGTTHELRGFAEPVEVFRIARA